MALLNLLRERTTVCAECGWSRTHRTILTEAIRVALHMNRNHESMPYEVHEAEGSGGQRLMVLAPPWRVEVQD